MKPQQWKESVQVVHVVRVDSLLQPMPRSDTSDSEWTRLFIDRVDSSDNLDDNL